MIAVDTNILVRYAVRDEPSQTLIVTQFLANHRCFILKTVLLELVWVLESNPQKLFNLEITMMMRTMADVPTSGTFLTTAEVEEISQAVEKEFPYDPALQAIYVARGIMRKEAEQVGVDYPIYIRELAKKIKSK
jgi:predicted nucleic acid-binding protein